MKKTIIKIFLVIIWMIVIFCFSNENSTESSNLSNGFIKNTISKVIKDDRPETIERFVKPVRKTAHFFIYLILGILEIYCIFIINMFYIFY